MQRISVILNARAGSLIGQDSRDIAVRVERALRAPGRDIDIAFAKGAAIARAIDRACAGKSDTVIVGGGDGSVSCAASRLAHSGRTLGVLPLGTLNLLARDLGMPADLAAALETIAQSRPRAIDLATINGRFFHSLSGLGFFSQMARAREETRDLPHRLLRVGVAAFRALTRTGRMTLALDIDGRTRQIDTYAALVTCNCFSKPGWGREALDGGMLEVHLAQDEGALARLKAGADLVAGQWRENAGIHSYPARNLRIAALRRRVWVATDGELQREAAPLEYAIAPRSLQVLMPSPACMG
jgi:diacylglycerol kinase family enzyme